MARKEREWTAEESEIVEGMREQLGSFLSGLARLHELGVPAGDTFQACGIDVPSYVAPLLDRALAKASEHSDLLAESPA